ncbi:MAG: hypothetical protein GWN14_14615, partial [candidate division Zixibacteria bacterium]|nr:hypothetical protein [Gammaproteobacteria bacterium]NIX57115.1 hypothetical protein [candidate division Zixibacteria bacterium]
DVVKFDGENHGYIFTHREPLQRLHSNLYKDRDYPTDFRNLLAMQPAPDSYGAYDGCDIQDFYWAIKRRSKVHDYVKNLNEVSGGEANMIGLQKNVVLKPGESTSVRFVRGVQDARTSEEELLADVERAFNANLQTFVDTNVDLFRSIPRPDFKNAQDKMVYLGAFNLVRQCMLPPRAKTSYNYYVFSRNPIWGWGHGHQVMHESLSMLSYVYLDAKSAQESQRVYMEQQYDNGLIAYRHGPRGPQVYPHQGKPTTSAPFFSWTNWEIYQVSQ